MAVPFDGEPLADELAEEKSLDKGPPGEVPAHAASSASTPIAAMRPRPTFSDDPRECAICSPSWPSWPSWASWARSLLEPRSLRS
jgi:hypothetical protein